MKVLNLVDFYYNCNKGFGIWKWNLTILVLKNQQDKNILPFCDIQKYTYIPITVYQNSNP